jgi:hypothetical protein
VGPETRAGERYATQVGELWSGLSRTLARLEAVAGAPEQLRDDEVVDALRTLQYRLHMASESVVGLSPPAASEPAHSELAAALEGARDVTGDVVDAVEDAGVGGVETLLHEWRGALFRVRLARLRLTDDRRAAEPAQQPPSFRAPLSALVLTCAGAAAFAGGATFGPWPVWVAGMVAICCSLLLYRP